MTYQRVYMKPNITIMIVTWNNLIGVNDYTINTVLADDKNPN